MRCLICVASLVGVVVLGLGIRHVSGAAGRDQPAKVVAAWASGPMEARIALRDAVSQGQAEALVGQEIELWPKGKAGAKPQAALRIESILRADQGRTLVLRTDPHPGDGMYRLAGKGIGYGLEGVEARWFEGAELDAGLPEGEAGWEGWGPSFDVAAWGNTLAGSAEHERLAGLLGQPGVLVLRGLVEVPEEGGELVVEAGQGVEGEVAYTPLEFEGGRAETEAEGVVELLLMMGTGGEVGRIGVAVGGKKVEAGDLILPWAPPAIEEPGEPSPLPTALEGGDAKRGETLFFGDQAKCSTCHRVGVRGTAVGPDLTGLATRMDRARVYREIESPSTVIHPDYRPYTVAAKDGRVVAGIVRAEGAEMVRVLDTTGKATLLQRDEVEEMSPSGTSIMPVGLVGVIGEAGMRDLMAYLEGLK